MNYPLISEYIEAIKSAEDNFDKLKHLRPVLDDYGQPVMSSGNFAVVFKMKDEQTGKFHAVKCFLREQKGRAQAYRMIAEAIEYVGSTFLTPIKYLEKELFVDTSTSDETEFPVLLMDWVEGVTLDIYIREHINDKQELSLLAYRMSKLAMWLISQSFAHGDLKPDNILVKKDGSLALVDYDGMYVPAMKGQKARELGSPGFRHPSRTEDDFDEHIDDFSLCSILFSLKAIAIQPSLLEKYGASDRLLFSEEDYSDLSSCQLLDEIKPLLCDNTLCKLLGAFLIAVADKDSHNISHKLFEQPRAQYYHHSKRSNISIEETTVNDYSKYKEKAENGDLEAETIIGKCFIKGQGVGQDYAEAVKWFRKAALQGYADAQYCLGVCFIKGFGVEQNYTEAVYWFRKAAWRKHLKAQRNLGICYDNGKGVEQNHKEAAKWFGKAARQGDAIAQYALGVCYYLGKGVEQNYVSAAGWYKKAAEQGHAEAQNNLGVCYEKEHGVMQDYDEAMKWYKKAAEQGLSIAQNNIAALDDLYSCIEASKWIH